MTNDTAAPRRASRSALLPRRARATLAAALTAVVLALLPSAALGPATAADATTYSISGTVSFSGPSARPSTVWIAARHQENSWDYPGSVAVAADGSYTIGGLVPGTYVLQLWGDGGYYSQLEGGRDTNDLYYAVSEVGIRLSGDVTGHDLTMVEGGWVTGAVTPGAFTNYTEVRPGAGFGQEVAARSQWRFAIIMPAGTWPVDIWRQEPGSPSMMRWAGATVTVRPGATVDVGTIDASRRAEAYTVTTPPSVTGLPVVGETLTAHQGMWTVADTSGASHVAGRFLNNQWLRDGVPIDGATGATHVLTAADAGARISLRVRADVSSHLASRDAVSPDTAPVAKRVMQVVTPRISGDAKPGGVLTATLPTGPGGAVVEGVWLRGSQEIGRGQQLTLGLADAGQEVRVQANLRHPDYDDADVLSDPVTVALAESAVTLDLPASPQVHGAPATVVASVTVPFGVDDGVVELWEGPELLDTAPVAGGAARLTVPATAAIGPHDLAARFVPAHPGVRGSTSAAARLEIAAPELAAAFRASSTPDNVAELVVTARLAGAPLGGAIRVTREGVLVGSYPLTGGQAVIAVPRGLALGGHRYAVEHVGVAGAVAAGPAITYTVVGPSRPGSGPTAGPVVAQGLATVVTGGEQRVVVTGFAPGEQVIAYMFSTPVLLGTFTADMLGTVVVEFTLPAGTPVGAHTLELRGASGVLAYPFTAAAPAPAAPVATAPGAADASPSADRARAGRAALPATGSEVAATLVTAALLVTAGGAAVVARSRGSRRPRQVRQVR